MFRGGGAMRAPRTLEDAQDAGVSQQALEGVRAACAETHASQHLTQSTEGGRDKGGDGGDKRQVGGGRTWMQSSMASNMRSEPYTCTTRHGRQHRAGKGQVGSIYWCASPLPITLTFTMAASTDCTMTGKGDG